MRYVVLLVLFLAACSSVGTQKLGDTVYVDAGPPAQVPVGFTRTAYDQISKSLAANDNLGAAQVIGAGEGTFVARCTPGKLIDTAFGGERELRLSDGRAVWLDANWVKNSCGS